MHPKNQSPSVLIRRIAKAASPRPGALGKTVPELRRLAEAARGRRDFNTDTYYRRQIIETGRPSMGDWIQYGHALKEAGFYTRAEKAYLTALDLNTGNADLLVQLGHLAKVRGDFPGAQSWFQKAIDLGHPAEGDIRSQLKIIARADNSTVFREVSPHMPRTDLRVYLSAPGGQVSENDKARMATGLGHSDYSYAFAMRGFIEAMEALEIDYVILQNPEYISDIRERSTAEINIHLGFYPPERLRLLKGAYNVNCFAWEFDRLRSREEITSYHAFAEQGRMLNLSDVVWTPSKHGAEAVRTSTQTKVDNVPAPLLNNLAKRPRSTRPSAREIDRQARALKEVKWQPLAILPRIQPQMSGDAKARETSLQAILASQTEERPPLIYLTIFNVHDHRKQIGRMIEGFLKFSQNHPEAILLCKMTTPHRDGSMSQEISTEQMDFSRRTLPMISDKIWLSGQVLTRDEMNALFDVATYYVCTSHAEGQNLPLLEAMGRGVVPISVDNTAMAEYIFEDNAVVIHSEKRPFTPSLTSRYQMYGLETYFVTADGVSEALERSVDLDEKSYATRSNNATSIVKQNYGLDRFAEKFHALVASLKTPEEQA